MIDVHTHILPGIDDGARNIEQTMKIIDEAYEAGFTDIITTSHYIEDTYDVDTRDRNKLIEVINPIIDKGIKLHNGAEAYISPEIVDLFADGTIPTLANSKYALFELPMNSEVIYVENIISKFIGYGYVPVIAHPERYGYVKRNIDKAMKFVEMGALLQCNYGSFIGKYGYDAQDVAIKLLTKDKISFLGTDNHRPDSIYTCVNKAIDVIRKNTNEKMVEKLTVTNPNKILRKEYL